MAIHEYLDVNFPLGNFEEVSRDVESQTTGFKCLLVEIIVLGSQRKFTFPFSNLLYYVIKAFFFQSSLFKSQLKSASSKAASFIFAKIKVSCFLPLQASSSEMKLVKFQMTT